MTIISAPAGYGKTSLLADFARDDRDQIVCWAKLDTGERDSTSLLTLLIESVKTRFHDFGSPTLLNGLQHNPPEVSARRLAAELHDLPDYLALILDDYQLIEDSLGANIALDELLAHLPDNCHLIIAGRQTPTLTAAGLAKLTAYRQVHGLGSGELRFTAEEVQQVIEKEFGRKISGATAEEIASQTEGWIVGILLSGQTRWRGAVEKLTQGPPAANRDTLYAYLTGEVLSHLPAGLRSFLYQTAVVEGMDPELGDALTGRTDSAGVLQELARRNIFIDQAGEQWRYHPLFREYLLAQSDGQPEIVVARRRAAKALVRRGDVGAAVDLYLDSHDYDRAAHLIQTIAEKLYKSGRKQTLRRWLEALPDEAVADHAQLQLFVARILLEEGDPQGAGEIFAKITPALLNGGPKNLAVASLIGQSTAWRFQGDLQRALACARQALDLSGQVGDGSHVALESRGHALRSSGICSNMLGDLAAGTAALREALELYERLGDGFLIARCHSDLGAALNQAGKLDAAEFHLRRAIQGWETLNIPGEMAISLNNLAVQLARRGRYDEAYTVFQRGLSAARQAGNSRMEAYLVAGLGDLLLDAGQLDEAMETYRQALVLADEVGESLLRLYILYSQGECDRRQGNLTVALRRAHQVYQNAQERGAAYERGLGEMLLGAVCRDQKDLERGIDWLARANRTFAGYGNRLELARSKLHLAYAVFLDRRPHSALHNLREVAGLVLDLGYSAFLRPVARGLGPMLEYFRVQMPSDAATRDLVRQLFTYAQEEPALEKPPVIAVEEPPQLSRLQVFGFGFPRVVAGNRILTTLDSGLVRGAEALFYFILNAGGHRRESVGAALWPDYSPEKLRATFHRTIGRFRRSLGSPDYLILRQDEYTFNHDLLAWCDVMAFEELLHRAENGRQLEFYLEALRLYSGDFLEGVDLHSEWGRRKQTELEMKYFHAVEQAAVLSLERDQYEQALELLERGINKDPYRESLYRLAMRAHAARGNSAAVRQTLEQLSRILETELGDLPSPETLDLFHQLLRTEE
ncbi:MAG: tetratricopeptide repeat protein [Anaerolineae bacterium]